MAKEYIIVDVGCLECGEPSSIVGIFKVPEIAEAKRQHYLKDKEPKAKANGYFSGGRHQVQILEYGYDE